MILTLTDISQASILAGKISELSGPSVTTGGFISATGELVESWKVNVNVIVVEAPHGWVVGPPRGGDWLYPTERHSGCV